MTERTAGFRVFIVYRGKGNVVQRGSNRGIIDHAMINNSSVVGKIGRNEGEAYECFE